MTLHPEKLSIIAGAWAILIVCVPVFLLLRLRPSMYLSALITAAAVFIAVRLIAAAYARRCSITYDGYSIVIKRGIIFRREVVIPRCRAVITEQIITPVDMLCRSCTLIIRAGTRTALIAGLNVAETSALIEELGISDEI